MSIKQSLQWDVYMQNFACDNNDFGRWTYLKMRDATTHGCYFVGAMASKQRAHAEKH
jgi:hypothetical protein